jgi:hypothetical protein
MEADASQYGALRGVCLRASVGHLARCGYKLLCTFVEATP